MKAREFARWMWAAWQGRECCACGKRNSRVMVCTRMAGHPGPHVAAFRFEESEVTLQELQAETNRALREALDREWSMRERARFAPPSTVYGTLKQGVSFTTGPDELREIARGPDFVGPPGPLFAARRPADPSLAAHIGGTVLHAHVGRSYPRAAMEPDPRD